MARQKRLGHLFGQSFPGPVEWVWMNRSMWLV